MDKTLTKFQDAVGSLNTTLTKINSNEGSLGMLINDKKLYNNLNATTNSLNILLQDFRIHPRRYTGGLVFGKKDKSPPLMTAVAGFSEQSYRQQKAMSKLLRLVLSIIDDVCIECWQGPASASRHCCESCQGFHTGDPPDPFGCIAFQKKG